MAQPKKRSPSFTERMLRAFWEGAPPLTVAEREDIITELTPLSSPGF